MTKNKQYTQVASSEAQNSTGHKAFSNSKDTLMSGGEKSGIINNALALDIKENNSARKDGYTNCENSKIKEYSSENSLRDLTKDERT